jgi:hypothetical protein
MYCLPFTLLNVRPFIAVIPNLQFVVAQSMTLPRKTGEISLVVLEIAKKADR